MVAHNDKQAERFFARGVHATGTTTIMRPAHDLYAAWRRFEDLPRFIDHLERVEVLDEKRSRWTTRGPAGRSYSWEAEIINDEPARLIAWKSIGDVQIPNAGSIRFQELPHERGTIVRVALEYVPAAGHWGDAFARAMGDDARSQLHEALHRFRQVMETGETAVSKGQPSGTNALRHDRPGESDRRRTDPDVRDIARTEAHA